MWFYFKSELKDFFLNRKNLAIYLLLLIISLFYFFQIESNFTLLEGISEQRLQASVASKITLHESLSKQEQVDPHIAGAAVILPDLIKNEQEQLQLLKENKIKELASLRQEWYSLTIDGPNPLYFKDGNPNASDDFFYSFMGMPKKLSQYEKAQYKVTLNMLNEKTAIQSLIRAMQYILPIVLLLVGLIFSMDMIAKDHQHKSLVKGLPITDLKKVFIKFIVSLFGVLLSVIPLSVGFIGIGLTSGFGQLGLPVSVSHYSSHIPVKGDMVFEVISAKAFIGKFCLMMLLLISIVIMLNLLLSFWIKNAYTLFILTLGVPFLDLFYNRFGYGDSHTITYLPTSYFRVGQVITGYRSFFFADTQLTFSIGLIVLGITCLILAVLLGVLSNKKRMV